MLSEQQIKEALHASRVVPLPGISPHGPLGLEHLTGAVSRLKKAQAEPSQRGHIQRLITLPVETWEKLEELARTATQAGSPPISASEVAAVLIQQGVEPQ